MKKIVAIMMVALIAMIAGPVAADGGLVYDILNQAYQNAVVQTTGDPVTAETASIINPPMTISVTTDKPSYVQGEKIKVTIRQTGGIVAPGNTQVYTSFQASTRVVKQRFPVEFTGTATFPGTGWCRVDIWDTYGHRIEQEFPICTITAKKTRR